MFWKQEDQVLVPCRTDVHGGLTAADVSGWCPDTDASDTGPNRGLVADQVTEVVKHWHDPGVLLQQTEEHVLRELPFCSDPQVNFRATVNEYLTILPVIIAQMAAVPT